MAAHVESDRACQQPDPGDPSTLCGAAAASDQRCLAHLTPDARKAWLAALAPGADIDARGVTFTGELLTELLNALLSAQNLPRFGTADFTGGAFTEDADFVHTIFTGDAVFTGATFTKDAQFESAIFTKAAWFDGATFTRYANFRNTIFTRSARFERATFGDFVLFQRATFSEDAVFRNTSFASDSVFKSTSFTGTALFDDATLNGNANFSQATFTANALFAGVTFSGGASFRVATFSDDVVFCDTMFTSTAAFSGATFTSDADFESATFSSDAWFDGTTFGERACFRNVNFTRNAGFYRVTCKGTVSLDDAVVQRELDIDALAKRMVLRTLRGEGRVSLWLREAEVDLTDVVLAGPVSVHGVNAIDGSNKTGPAGCQARSVRVVSLRGLDVSSLTLTDVDLSQCQFVGIRRADQIVLDGQCMFAHGPGGRRRVLAEEHHWRATRSTRTAGQASQPYEPRGWLALPDISEEPAELVGPARLEVLYRQLRKALEDGKNEPGAADFYYGEMEMRRLGTKRRAERWLLGLYWAVSGYGLRARRALAWLALLIILSIGGLTWFGFPQTAKEQKASGAVVTQASRQPITLNIRQADPVKPLPDRIEKAIEITVNAVIFRSPDTDLTTAGRYLNIATRILGPVLLGLSVLAIRNQVKR